jgi:hypothetical protein
VGAVNGQLYEYQGRQLARTVSAHTKAVHCLRAVEDKVVSGGADNKVCVFDQGLNKLSEMQVDSTPRSLDCLGDKVLAGLRSGTIAIL